MLKAVIFDLDGTLLYTVEDLCDSVNYALSSFGFPAITLEMTTKMIGNGVRNLITRAAPEGTDECTVNELLAHFKSHYKDNMENKTKAYDGIVEMLGALKKKGIKTAVLSNKPDVAVKTLAKEYFQDLLTEAAGENEAAGIRKKPAPDALFALIERLDVTKAETLYVGDSEVDILTAKNAGVDCVSVSWGFKTREFLKANGAQCIVDEPNALASHCGL